MAFENASKLRRLAVDPLEGHAVDHSNSLDSEQELAKISIELIL
jgi:hypothetical protein